MQITKKQQEIYDYIQSYVAEKGYPPSMREICTGVGLASPSSAHYHVSRMEEVGLLQRTDGKTRAIALNQSKQEAKTNVIPVINRDAGPDELTENDIECYIPFHENGNEGDCFAFRIRGNSMILAGILPGDIVVIHPQQKVNMGQIVAIRVSERVMIRTISRKNGDITFMAENEKYEPISGDDAEILGKVVGLVRYY